MIGTRLLRKRWFLGLIFGCSLVYFIASIYRQSVPLRRVESEPKRLQVPVADFKWQVDSPVDPSGQPTGQVAAANRTKTVKCRNSLQGKTLIADDKGYVCKRSEVTLGGCCDVDGASTKRHECSTCSKAGCCEEYEHCVSCCLRPDKQPLLRKILTSARESFHQLFASVTDHFELCLAKCRTSSMSVQHENSYRDPKSKYCYGADPPELRPLGMI